MYSIINSIPTTIYEYLITHVHKTSSRQPSSPGLKPGTLPRPLFFCTQCETYSFSPTFHQSTCGELSFTGVGGGVLHKGPLIAPLARTCSPDLNKWQGSPLPPVPVHGELSSSWFVGPRRAAGRRGGPRLQQSTGGSAGPHLWPRRSTTTRGSLLVWWMRLRVSVVPRP